jgi:hypothetical protein
MTKTSLWLGVFAILSLLFISGIAVADSGDDDDIDGPLRLTMDQTRLVHLDQDAASVIVANPGHVSVSLDNPRLLIVTPHDAGATSMIVLDGEGKTILEQDIIVTNVQQKYVRIKRMCAGGDASCVEKSYTYCPDGCYEVTPVAPDFGAAAPPPPMASDGADDGAPAPAKQ